MIDIVAICERIGLLSLCPDVRSVGDEKWRGRCPLCDSSDRLSVRKASDGLQFLCFACGKFGDAVDLYGALHNLKPFEVLSRFASDNSPTVTRDERLGRIADAAQAREWLYLLTCETCPRTKEVKTELDAVIILDGGSNWEVAPDGIGAICPSCLSTSAQRRFNELRA